MVVLDDHGVSGLRAREPRDTDVLHVARHVGGRHARDRRVGPRQAQRGLRLVDAVDGDPLQGRVPLGERAGEDGGDGEREREEGELHGGGVEWRGEIRRVVLTVCIYIYIHRRGDPRDVRGPEKDGRSARKCGEDSGSWGRRSRGNGPVNLFCFYCWVGSGETDLLVSDIAIAITQDEESDIAI